MNKPYILKNTAVLFLIFNRPDTTEKVFEAIREAKPPRLYIGSDGSRDGKEGEKELVEQARKIATTVDWECEVRTLFRDKNLGCKIGVSTAIDWFFENEEMGIILEDDCLPDNSFFPFCEELLEKYKDDMRVGLISGNNFQKIQPSVEESYYFSIYNHIWGWASWRRAWKLFDRDFKFWEIAQKQQLLDSMNGNNKQFVKYWTRIFNNGANGKIDTWDYPWTFSLWVNHSLSILPQINLVENIGFGESATHTKGTGKGLPEKNELSFPLSHPFMIVNKEADSYTQQRHFSTPSFQRRILNKLKRIIL